MPTIKYKDGSTWKTLALGGTKMTGASATAAGKQGEVPAPAMGQQDYFLKGDGTWAPAFIAGESIPTTQSQFESLSWADIRKLAQRCLDEGKPSFWHMLGFTKNVNISGFGNTKFRLVSFNPKRYVYNPELNGSTASDGNMNIGFLFECVDVIGTNRFNTSTTCSNVQYSALQTYLQDTVYAALPSDLRVSLRYANLGQEYYYSYSGTWVSMNNAQRTWTANIFFSPVRALTGSNSDQSEIFSQYDYYAENSSASARIKNMIGTSTPTNYWTQTLYISGTGTSNTNMRAYYINTAGNSSTTYVTEQYGVVPCFGLGK